jgi:hypothetical protein
VLGPLRFDSVELLGKTGVSYTFSANAKDAGAGGGQRGSVVRMMQEISTLATTLPIEYNASIFVRVDESRPDVLKALISGPVDTPYQNGLFVFDIFLPPTYPAVPPKVLALTTGAGRWRGKKALRLCMCVCTYMFVCLEPQALGSKPWWSAHGLTVPPSASASAPCTVCTSQPQHLQLRQGVPVAAWHMVRRALEPPEEHPPPGRWVGSV